MTKDYGDYKAMTHSKIQQLKQDKYVTYSLFIGLVCISITFLDNFILGFLMFMCAGLTIPCLFLGFMIVVLRFCAVLAKKFIQEQDEDIKVTALPIVIIFISFGISIANIIYLPNLELGFRWRLGRYQEVIRLVEMGKIRVDPDPSNFYRFATLPIEYSHLTDTGKISIYKMEDHISIIFYTSVGILGEYSGYIYRSDNIPPPEDFSEGCDVVERVKVNIPNWFHCLST